MPGSCPGAKCNPPAGTALAAMARCASAPRPSRQRGGGTGEEGNRLQEVVSRKSCGAAIVWSDLPRGPESPKASAWNALAHCRVATLRRGAFILVGPPDYRRYAQACLEMADATVDRRTRAVFIQMAQVWLRLADDKAVQPEDFKEDAG